jgi:hypothetical protein
MPNTAAEIQGTGLKIRNNLREQIDLVIEAGGDYLRDCGECTFFKNPTPNFTHTPVISHHHPRTVGFNDKWLKPIFLAFSIFSVFDFQRFGFEEHQVFAVNNL